MQHDDFVPLVAQVVQGINQGIRLVKQIADEDDDAALFGLEAISAE